MLCFGSYAQEYLGEICRLIMAIGTLSLKDFVDWVKRGVWEGILEILLGDYYDEYEWLIIDASHVKVHPHGCGAVGGDQDMARTKGGSTPKYIYIDIAIL